MSLLLKYDSENKPFSHMFYFRLVDTSEKLIYDFMNICLQCLSGHPGQTHFPLGYRALEIYRPVSAKNFEISVNMIFSDFAAYEKYSNDPRNQEFITLSAGMSTDRIVYDSFLYLVAEPKRMNKK